MTKRGVALIFSFLVVIVLSILVGSFSLSTITENKLAKQYVHSTRAFWLAEAGIAEAVDNLPNPRSGWIGNSNYTYSTQTKLISSGYYNITSTGSVVLPSGETFIRTLEVIVKTEPADSTKFKFAIETTADLDIRGSISITSDICNCDPDPKKCDQPPCQCCTEQSQFDFTDLFGYSKTDIKAKATHSYTKANFGPPVDGITWVDVSTGETLSIAGNLVGSGILIISGNTYISGTVTFNGIIYIIGQLRITGSVTVSGGVLAESGTELDTELKGNVTLNRDTEKIDEALVFVELLTKRIVSWKEEQTL